MQQRRRDCDLSPHGAALTCKNRGDGGPFGGYEKRQMQLMVGTKRVGIRVISTRTSNKATEAQRARPIHGRSVTFHNVCRSKCCFFPPPLETGRV